MKKIIIVILVLAMLAIAGTCAYACGYQSVDPASALRNEIYESVTEDSVYAVVKTSYSDGTREIAVLGVNEYDGCNYVVSFSGEVPDYVTELVEYCWAEMYYVADVEA